MQTERKTLVAKSISCAIPSAQIYPGQQAGERASKRSLLCGPHTRTNSVLPCESWYWHVRQRGNRLLSIYTFHVSVDGRVVIAITIIIKARLGLQYGVVLWASGALDGIVAIYGQRSVPLGLLASQLGWALDVIHI